MGVQILTKLRVKLSGDRGLLLSVITQCSGSGMAEKILINFKKFKNGQ